MLKKMFITLIATITTFFVVGFGVVIFFKNDESVAMPYACAGAIIVFLCCIKIIKRENTEIENMLVDEIKIKVKEKKIEQEKRMKELEQ